MTNVLIADVLKHFTGEFSELVALGVDEMAEIPPGTACRTMKILTRNSSVVTWLNELVRVWRRIESLISNFLLVCFLELRHCIVGELDQLVMVNFLILVEQVHDVAALIYKN